MDVITYACSNFDADFVKGDQLGIVWIMDTHMSEVNVCSKLEGGGQVVLGKRKQKTQSLDICRSRETNCIIFLL